VVVTTGIDAWDHHQFEKKNAMAGGCHDTPNPKKGVIPLPHWGEKTNLPVVGPTITVEINGQSPPKLEPNKIAQQAQANVSPQNLATIFLQKLYRGCTRRVETCFCDHDPQMMHPTISPKLQKRVVPVGSNLLDVTHSCIGN
jgi:hypothetical protein